MECRIKLLIILVLISSYFGIAQNSTPDSTLYPGTSATSPDTTNPATTPASSYTSPDSTQSSVPVSTTTTTSPDTTNASTPPATNYSSPDTTQSSSPSYTPATATSPDTTTTSTPSTTNYSSSDTTQSATPSYSTPASNYSPDTTNTSSGTQTTPPDTTSKNWFDVINKLDSTNQPHPPPNTDIKKPTEGGAYNYQEGDTVPTTSTYVAPPPVSRYATPADSLEALEDSLAGLRPYIGYGNGVFTYSGEIKDNYRNNPDIGRIGYSFSLSKKVNKYIDGYFFVMLGKLSGNYRSTTPEKNMNFMTDIVTGGISLSYNFKHLLKKPCTFRPFIAIGLESFEFNSKADMKDRNGYTYYYWSDGSIRNVPENSPNAKSSILLERDYKYETDLREQNLDGLGKYQQIAFGIPLDIGFDFKISNRLKMRIGNAFHFTFNDLIDNVNSKSKGTRKGNSGMDRFLFTYITFHFDIFTGKIKSAKDLLFENMNIDSLFAEDADGDGIKDGCDKCQNTPIGAVVDPDGCPLDSDADGVPDPNDIEPGTTKLFYVSPEGVGESQEEFEARHATDTVGIDRDKVAEYYPSLQKPVKHFTTFYIEIPPKFRIFDSDKDGYISPAELSKAIDMFFDFGANLSVDDIYELNDFFFDQEVDTGDEDF